MNEETPRRKISYPIQYILILLLSASLLVLLAMHFRLQDRLDNRKQEVQLLRTENELLCEQLQAVTNGAEDHAAMAAELVALAQNSYYKEDIVAFHAYMAMLEGYADALPDRSLEIYEELRDSLSLK